MRAIGSRGLHRFTLAEVGAAVGLSPATLLQRFGSKRGLLLAAAGREGEAVPRQFAAARRAHASPLAALMAVSLRQVRSVETPDALASHVAFFQPDLEDAEFRRRAVDASRRVRAEIKALLDAAVESGELAACETARLASAVHAQFKGSLLSWAIHREGSPEDWVREDLETLLRPRRTGPGPAAEDPTFITRSS